MASLIPKHVKKEITDGWVGETWKLMLLNNTHTPNASTQQYVSDVSAKEIADAGGKYTAGGVACGAALKTSVADGNNYFLDCPDIIIGTGASLNYRYGILFHDTGNPATSKIRAQIDFVTDQIVTNGTSTIQWNALGIIYVS
jgi:hypothetical protein